MVKKLYLTSTWLFLLAGVTYLILSQYSMGFNRDLIYREYILETQVLLHVNFYFVASFWGLLAIWMLYSYLHVKQGSYLMHMLLFAFICALSLAYMQEMVSVMALMIVSIFGLLHVKVK